ncbi:MAG: arsC [Chitinophagaceae bacterium]|nr:arsC [Chitinophagaceae bacterium]
MQELEESGEEVEIREYLKTIPTVKELKELCAVLNIKPEELVRKTEPIYKEKYQGKTLTDIQWLKALAEHPVLIQRPIVWKGNKAVIAREAGTLAKFLK